MFEVIGCYYHTSVSYKTVDSSIGATVHLFCGLCGDTQEYFAVHWFYRQRGNFESTRLISPGRKNNSIIHILRSGKLVISPFDITDSGIYMCVKHKESNVSFTYVVDGIFKLNGKPQVGTHVQYWKYEANRINKLNHELISSQNEPYASLRKSKITFELNISWGIWSPCELNHYNKGIRRKLGHFRLYPKPANSLVKFTKHNIYDELVRYYLEDNFDISCRSIKLNKSFPSISRIVRNLPDYEVTEPCQSDLDVNVNKKINKEDQEEAINITTVRVAENGHCTLICAEELFGSKLVWYKDRALLNSSFRNNIADKRGEPHIFIDPYNYLNILHATKGEEGHYLCTINDIKVREYFITVVSIANILNQDFIRYSIYLGFILSITVMCYCAGLFVAWHRRASFADPLNLDYRYFKKKDYSNVINESEALLQKK